MPYQSTQWKKPRFSVVKNEFSYHWTAILPTQRHPHETKKDAMRQMAQVIKDIRDGRIDFVYCNVAEGGTPERIMGGLQHVLDFLPKVKKPTKKKPTKKKPTKRKKA